MQKKHTAFKSILRILNLPERPEYFSTGGTVTTEAFEAVRDVLLRHREVLRNFKDLLNI